MEIYKDKHPVAPLLSSTDHPDKDLPYSKKKTNRRKEKEKSLLLFIFHTQKQKYQ
jgi:hypothetical protein